MSYSQNSEEAVLLDYFGNKTDGAFLEIGAFHPTKHSNTRALIERGWSGVMVEMSPYGLVDLLKAYKDNERIRIVAGAVTIGAQPPASVWLMPKDAENDGAISTTETWHRDKWAGRVSGKHIAMTAATLSMTELMWMLPPQIDLVSIDTEGTSVQIASAFDFDRFGVKAVVLEHDGAQEIAMPASFRVAAMNTENVIFVR
jgi:hypothetical protein